MKIFLDANILISVLNKEYPLFSTTSRILSLADKKNFSLFTSPVCLAIAYYFAEKKHGRGAAKSKIELLTQHLQITTVNKSCVSKTLQSPAINDFEDGLEYFSAEESKCNCIITENVKDFYFSKIEAVTSEDFFKKYMLRKN